MNSNMVKPEKFGHFPLVYHFKIPLKRHIQVGRLPVQGTWLGLVSQSVIGGSMWPTGQTSNNSVISR